MSEWKSAAFILNMGPQSAAHLVYISVASPSKASSSWPHSQLAISRGCSQRRMEGQYPLLLPLIRQSTRTAEGSLWTSSRWRTMTYR